MTGFLSEYLALVKSVELSKNALINCADFNIHDAFRIFDVTNGGAIDMRDFRETL